MILIVITTTHMKDKYNRMLLVRLNKLYLFNWHEVFLAILARYGEKPYVMSASCTNNHTYDAFINPYIKFTNTRKRRK